MVSFKRNVLRKPQNFMYVTSFLNFFLLKLYRFQSKFILQIFAFIITLVYSGVNFDSDSSVQDVKGFLVILATEVLFTFVYSVFYLFYEVLPILRKETGDRLYSLSAYYVSLVVLMVRVISRRPYRKLFTSFFF